MKYQSYPKSTNIDAFEEKCVRITTRIIAMRLCFIVSFGASDCTDKLY